MEAYQAMLAGAFLAGLLYGAGPCNISCLPYLGPVMCGGIGAGGAWGMVLPFTAGRLAGYAGLGAAAGLAGHTLSPVLRSPVSGWVLGCSAIITGVSLWAAGRATRECSTAAHRLMPAAGRGGLFSMGVGMTLTPCAPMSAVLLSAAATASMGMGLGLGVAFGLGAAIGPALMFGVLMARFGGQMRANMGWAMPAFAKGLAAFMILLGSATFLGYVAP